MLAVSASCVCLIQRRVCRQPPGRRQNRFIVYGCAHVGFGQDTGGDFDAVVGNAQIPADFVGTLGIEVGGRIGEDLIERDTDPGQVCSLCPLLDELTRNGDPVVAAELEFGRFVHFFPVFSAI